MSETTSTTEPKNVWPCLNYADAPAAIRFLTEAFGFVEIAHRPRRSEDVVVTTPSCAGPRAAA